MLTTIEQKLSAIKAINEEKDQLEEDIARCIRIGDVSNSVTSIQIKTETNSYDFYLLPPDIIIRLNDVVRLYLQERKSDLIRKAVELMK
jgi:hypothetical protein